MRTGRLPFLFDDNDKDSAPAMTEPSTPTILFDGTEPLGASADLQDNGKPLFFQLPNGQKAFVIRWQGQLHGWINECQHASVPMDFDGDILESGRQFILCPYHGAIYQPDTGKCVGGPCRGSSLDAVAVEERDGTVWLKQG